MSILRTMSPQEKLAHIQKIITECKDEWAAAQSSSQRLAVSEKAAQQFWPGHPANSIHLWYKHPEVGNDLQLAVLELRAITRWFNNYCWDNANLAERREMNRNDTDYRLSAKSRKR